MPFVSVSLVLSPPTMTLDWLADSHRSSLIGWGRKKGNHKLATARFWEENGPGKSTRFSSLFLRDSEAERPHRVFNVLERTLTRFTPFRFRIVTCGHGGIVLKEEEDRRETGGGDCICEHRVAELFFHWI
jgi:hypothetical protein